MTAATVLAEPLSESVLAGVLDRASDPEHWLRFERQLRSAGYCRRPVRLRGEISAVDHATGEVRTTFTTVDQPDGTLLKCCGNRREAVCPSCAEVYRGDAFQLVAAGLRGGKGVPETVAAHPVVFATLTAPSFGAVHSRRLGPTGEPRRCRPRRDAPRCTHGVTLNCGAVHEDGDPCLGEPLCPECFDYEHAVLWNALAPELWRRTSNRIARELARLTDVSERRLRERVRVSYVKVAEYQARGALHFHVVIRLDAAQPKDTRDRVEPPPADVTVELLAEAIRAAVRATRAPVPNSTDASHKVQRPSEVRWGAQVDVRVLEAGEAPSLAGYVAKYATKSTEVVGGLTHRLAAADIAGLRVRDHVRRLVECAWRLGGEPDLRELRLRRWAHALGFRGHCFTKSRRYSTTFTVLRRARHQHALKRAHPKGRRDPWGRPVGDGASREWSRFTLAGIGYRTPGDTWLAESGAARRSEERRVAREELRAARQAELQINGP
jgi:hypothetical protein